MPSAFVDTFQLLRRLYYLSILSGIIMLPTVSDYAVMFTEIRVRIPCRELIGNVQGRVEERSRTRTGNRQAKDNDHPTGHRYL